MPDGEAVDAGENISIWQGSVITLRASDVNNDQSRDVRLGIPRTTGVLDGGEAVSLGKSPLYIYRQGEPVAFEFDGGLAGDATVIEDRNVQVVTAHLEKGVSTPGSLSEVSNLLTANDNVNASVQGSFTGRTGANEFAVDADQSGQYIVAFVAVHNDSKQGLADTNGDGNLEATSNVTVVGFDHLPVHEERSTVEVPDAAPTGSNVSVTVDSGDAIASDNVSHTVVLFNETLLEDQDSTVYVNDSEIDRVETSIERINGSRRIVPGTNIAGITPGESTYTGSTRIVTVLEDLFGSGVQNVEATDDTVLHIAATSKLGGPRETVSLEVTEDFPTGDYQVLHIATARDGEQTVSNKTDLPLVEGTNLNITANRTSVTTGSPVELNVTRDDTDEPVDATVEFDGDTLTTGADGTVIVTPTESGTFTATASKAPQDGDLFVNDSVDITVTEPASIEYSNLSVSPRTVPTNAIVTVNVTVENTGETEGTYNTSLLVDGAETGDEQNGTLAPGESKPLTFETSFEKPGAKRVTVDDLVAQRVLVLAPAAFDPGNVEASPRVNVSEQFRVSVPVNNTGDIGGTYAATLTVTNESDTVLSTRTRSVFVGGGENETIRFRRVATQAENLTVEVNGTPVDPATTTDTVRVDSPDLLPPSILLESPSQGETPYGRTINLNVTDADSSVVSVTTQFNDGPQQSQTPGSIVLNTTDLTEGTNTLTVTATDEAGNLAEETYTFDFVSSPRITSVSPTGVAGENPTVVVTYADDRAGSAETGIDTDATRLIVNGNETDLSGATTNNETTLVVSPEAEDLTTGTNRVRVEVTDNASHTTVRRFSFGRDTTPPEVSIESETITSVGTNDPAELDLTANDDDLGVTRLVVTNATEDETVYTENLTALARATGGTFETEWDSRDDGGSPVPDGEYNITLVANDTAGNTNDTSVTTTVDNTAPTFTFNYLNNSDQDTVDASTDTTLYTNDTTLYVNGTVSEDVDLRFRVTSVQAGGTVTTLETNADAGTGMAQIDLSSLSDGRYRVTALVTDETDNTNRTTATAVVEIDTTSPTLGATLRLTNDNEDLLANVTSDEPLADTPTVSIDTPSGTEAVQLSQVGNSELYQGTLDTNQSGSYNLTATGVDLAGNTRTSTANTTLSTTDIGEDQNITILGPNTFVFIETNKTNIAGGVSDVTYRLSETESLGIALSGRNAQRFLQAEVGGLSDDQIDRVTYGFNENLVPPGLRNNPAVDIRVLYFPEDGGIEFLETTPTSNPTPPGVSGNYYVAEREGLSDYALYTSDTEDPEITFDTPSNNPATFPAGTSSVDISASATDNLALNESNITVTFNDGTGSTDVTQEANIINNSVDDKTVNYTATGLSAGEYNLTITARDQNRTANTNSSTFEFSIAEDTDAPNITDVNPNGTTLAYGTEQVELNATYEDSDAGPASGVDTENISIVFDGTELGGSEDDADGTANRTVSGLQNGQTYTLNVSVPDNAGNVATKNVTFSVGGDDVAPTVTIDKPVADKEFPSTTTNVTLNASAADTGGSGLDENSIAVYYDGVDKTSAASVEDPTNITYTKENLESGTTHNLTVVAVDNAGNRNLTTHNFSIGADTDAPSITKVSYPQELGNDEDLDLVVNYTDDDSGIDPTSLVLQVNGTDYADQADISPNPGASVNVSAENLSTGEQSIFVSVSDNASNTETNLSTFTVNEGANLEVTEVQVNETSVLTEEPVAVNVSVQNFGDESGNKTLVASTGDTVVNETEVSGLAPDAISYVEFTTNFTDPGDVELSVNGTTSGTIAVQSRTANFVVTNEVVPSPVTSGDSVTIEATIQNTGTQAGTVANFTEDGTVVDTTNVSLKPSQAKTVTLTRTLTATGSDRQVQYKFGGLTLGTVTVSPTPSNFQIRDYEITPTTVNPGEDVTVTADVRNVGGEPGTFDAALSANGAEKAKNSTTIANGATKTLTYTVSFGSPGTYQLSLGKTTLTPNVTVERQVSQQPSSSSGGGGGGSIGPRTVASVTGFITGGQSASVSLGPSGTGVESIDFEFSDQTAGQVKVTELNRPPEETGYTRNYADTVVSVVDITVPNGVTDRPATLTFSVKRSRLAQMGVTPADLQVEHYTDGRWTVLDSQVVSSNDRTVQLRVQTPSFSLFAVTTKSEQTTPTAQPTTQPTTQPTEATQEPTDEEPGSQTTGTATVSGSGTPGAETTSTTFPGFGAALTLVALLAAMALIARRKD